MRSGHNWLIHNINRDIVLNCKDIISGTVYDLGCGSKPYENIILSFAEKYIGVDWGNTFHAHKMDVLADLNEDLPIESQVADTVVSFQVIEHLSDPQNFLKEAYRILKPEGRILLTVPFQWHVHEAPYDYYRFTSYGLRHLFLQTGFGSIEVQPNGGFWVTFFLKLNYQSLRWIKKTGVFSRLFSFAMNGIWYVNQHLATYLDKLDYNEQEAISYTVTAQKHNQNIVETTLL